MKKVLVFDFGASSARAMLCYCENGKIITDEIHRFPNDPVEKDGTLFWNIDFLLGEVSAALKKAEEIGFDAVSVDTWGVDFGLYGEDGKLLEPPVHYRDRRTEGIPEKLYKIIPESELYSRTGIQLMRINTIFQLYSLALDRPELLKKTKKILLMPDIFCNFLTGEFKTEYTEATTTQLLNPRTKNWDYGLFDLIGVDRALFMPIIRPGEVYGWLKPEFSAKKIPVIAAPSHDTASAIAAVPSSENDFLYISCGTWALFGTELSEPVINDEARSLGMTNEGGYGGKITFQKNIMGMWLLQESRRCFASRGREYTFSEMCRLAETAEYCGALIDPNDKMFELPGRMPDKVCEYCEKTNQPVPRTDGEILRIIYESLSQTFAETAENISQLTGKKYECIHIFGGGCRDTLLCELTEKKSGMKVFRGPAEATAAGNAICALIALGDTESISQARKMTAYIDK